MKLNLRKKVKIKQYFVLFQDNKLTEDHNIKLEYFLPELVLVTECPT